MTGCRPRSSSSAFTLIELLLALALATIVLSALQSLIMIAGRAVPDTGGVQASTVAASDALERLAAEVSVAVEVLEVSATSITFSVNDWSGDDTVETIRYAWSGTVGDPLLRGVNGGLASVLVDSVENFSLSATTMSADVEVAGTGGSSRQRDVTVQSASVLDAIPDPVTASLAYAQRIVPGLPIGADSWRVNDVKIWVSAPTGSSGEILLEIRDVDPDTGFPGSKIYTSDWFRTSGLTSTPTLFSAMLNSAQFSVAEDLCIVVRSINNDMNSELEFGLSAGSAGGRRAWTSPDGGATWADASGKAMEHEVIADVWIVSTVTETRTKLVGLETMLQQGAPLTTIKRAVRPLNCPEVLP